MPKGLDEVARNMVDKDIIWNLGASSNSNETTASQFYEKERGTLTWNNRRQTEWSIETDVGEKHNGIGLMYPSDFGYAVGSDARNSCLSQSLFEYRSNMCANNDWLKRSSGYLLTLTPYSGSYDYVFDVYYYGLVNMSGVNYAVGVWPTLYLKSTVKITPNPHSEQEYGTVDNPFVLSLSN